MRRLIAKIAVAKAVYSIDRPFDYLVPAELEGQLTPGMRVLVPFGAGNRGSDGLVLALEWREGVAGPLKPIQAQLDETAVLDEAGIRLALWMRERYFCTVYDAVKAMLPAGLYFALQDRLKIAAGLDRAQALAEAQTESETKLLTVLEGWGGSAELKEICQAFGTRNPNPAIHRLKQAGVIELETTAQRGVGDKQEQLAVLKMPAEEAMALVTPRRKGAPLRYAVTEQLCALGAASAKELCYFTGASMSTLKSLERSGILALERQEVLRRVSLGDVPAAGGPPVLNEEQQTAFEGLQSMCQAGKAAAALLWGVTGSGKTQVYIRLIQDCLAQGKSALVLVPEIALTPQLMRIFASHFGARIAVLHSGLRSGERYDEWKRIRRGDADVVLGTRSAVFAPLKHLGLIVLDEEQESSYKSENVPRYHAREVAKYRCVQQNALLLLGSATPAVETMYAARQGTYRLFTLKNRYNQKALPEVVVADMKAELRRGNGGTISAPLQQALEEVLERGEQAILFLNRRGASRMVSCGECGEVPGCPRCSVKLTYHSANNRLMCHYCGYSQPLMRVCPSCGGMLNFVGAGTQRVEEELQKCFPGAEILRMDTDTVSASNSHEKMLTQFRSGKASILVGTQMVAKGLDFENVTLVGVVAPDQSLYLDDFRASERTFSLLTQVVGRAGRGEKQGRAVLQTYTPENDVIRFAVRQDYPNFYRQEIEMRRLRGYPPFADLFVITASGGEEGRVLRTCARLRSALSRALEGLEGPWQLLGPAPASVAKVNNRYRYRLTLAAKNTHAVRAILSELLQTAHRDRENRGISVFADVNPYNL